MDPSTTVPGPKAPNEERLQSWKEIASYLRFGLRTVQRWEATEGLPVHRHVHDKRSAVFAFKRELDEWYESRRSSLKLEGSEAEDSVSVIESAGEPPDESLAARSKFAGFTRSIKLGAVFLTLAGGVVALILVVRSKPPAANSLRLSVLPPSDTSFSYGTDSGGAAISPDGLTLAFVADSEGVSKLWVRPLSSTNSRYLPGSEGARYPFWSPDSRSIAFFALGKLKTTLLTGSAPAVVCDAAFGRGGTWNSRGQIAFTPAPGSSLRLVSDREGGPKELTRLDASLEENAHLWPHFLPDGRHFLYLARSSNPENTAIYVSSIDGAQRGESRKRLLNATSNVLYSKNGPSGGGHLLFARDGKLWAQPFDADSLEIIGDPRVIADQVGFWSNLRLANFSVSRAGSMIAYSTAGSDLTEVNSVNREGRMLSRLAGPDLWFAPRLSPNGAMLAIARTEISSGRSNLWLLEFSRGVVSRFTTSPGRDGSPVWSPDAARIVFLSVRGGPFALYLKNANGSGAEQLLGRRADSLIPFDWSGDGRFLLFGAYTSTSRLDLWMWPLVGSQKPFPVLNTPADELDGQFSSDGRWIAFTSDESGRDEVYVQAAVYEEKQARPSDRRWQVSSTGGAQPKWRADGKEIFYRSAAGLLTSVSVRAAASGLVFGAPQPLFPLRGTPQLRGTYTYDAFANGQHFIVLSPIEHSDDTSMTIITAW